MVDTVSEAPKHVAWLVNTRTGEQVRILPSEEAGPKWDEWPSWSEGLDQGSKGCGWANFLESLAGDDQMLFQAVWDIIHRQIRDLKLIVQKCEGGEYHKVHLQTSFIWNVCEGPFHSCTRLTEKRDAVFHSGPPTPSTLGDSPWGIPLGDHPGGSPRVIPMGDPPGDPPWGIPLGDHPGGSPRVITTGDPNGGSPVGDLPG